MSWFVRTRVPQSPSRSWPSSSSLRAYSSLAINRSVQMFLDKLTFNAVGAIEVAGVDSQALAGTAALAAGLAASASHHAPMEARHDHRQLNKRRVALSFGDCHGQPLMCVTDHVFHHPDQWLRLETAPNDHRSESAPSPSDAKYPTVSVPWSCQLP